MLKIGGKIVMKYEHLKDIDLKSNINERVFGIFLARDVDVRTQKDGVTKFISLNMCDRGIVVEAKKFGATDEDIEKMRNGKVYYGAIDIKPYAKSSTGYGCSLYNFDEFDEDPTNFIEWADGMNEAQKTVQQTLNKISKSIYKDLVYNLLIEHWKEFCLWEAASGMHHNILGGLLVHTAEVIEQCEILVDYWENKYGNAFLNRPLLLSGAILHDIGKIKELNVDTLSGACTYSTQASLETHITICISMIDIEAYKLKLGYQVYETNELGEKTEIKTTEIIKKEQEAVRLLKHMILSHHGKLEYGSPIVPSIPEAYILNKADEISAEMFRYNKNFKTMEPETSHSVWLGGNIVNTYKDGTKK